MAREEFDRRFAAARRRAVEKEFEGLNDMQLAAVMSTEGPLLILAGAGSGKTTVLIDRIANIMRFGRASDSEYVPERVTEDDLAFLEQYNESGARGPDEETRALALCRLDPAPPWRIIAITFTNKAAGEVKARLEQRIGSEAADIWAMTFHSACARILRRDIAAPGFNGSFAIYDASDSVSLMKRVLKDLNLDDKTYPPKAVLNAISRAKDKMISAQEYHDEARKNGDIRGINAGRAYIEYANRMRAANALDFDDLLLFTVRLLSERDDVREFYQNKFLYIMIDEYQDTNNLQYKFAELLAGGRGNICVVGDDDQSIYKFRGATIGNILNFEHRYKNAKLIRLEENYRSTAYILAAANDVIRNNTGRRGKNLWTRKAGGEKPALYVAANERDEARFVAESIVASVGRGGKWSDNAVLYRMNAQSNQLEHAFKGAGVPYRVLGGVSFYERAEIKDILSYLCVINNPSDDLRLLRIINNPARGIGQRTIAQLSELAAREREPIFALIQRAGQYAELQKSAARLRAFYDMMSGLRELAASAPPPELYDALIESSGYVRALETGSTIENMARVENVSELKTNILNYMEDNSGGSLDGFLSETALYANLDRDDGENDRAVLMTMHSAKGLEFDNVFIVGADEGVFPGARAIGEPDEMEEERRLCYVAITRARKTLCFVSARQRTLFGRTTPGNASRFIGEISAENINRPRGGRSGGYVFDDDTYADAAERPRSGAARGRATYAPPPARGDASGERGQTRPSALDLSVGDVVEHKAFGRGLVTLVQHGGKDALLEIAFDSGGTKRFMLNTVSQYLSLA